MSAAVSRTGQRRSGGAVARAAGRRKPAQRPQRSGWGDHAPGARKLVGRPARVESLVAVVGEQRDTNEAVRTFLLETYRPTAAAPPPTRGITRAVAAEGMPLGCQ
jgi:hypothetical protein